jgi:hypothetical protein
MTEAKSKHLNELGCWLTGLVFTFDSAIVYESFRTGLPNQE